MQIGLSLSLSARGGLSASAYGVASDGVTVTATIRPGATDTHLTVDVTEPAELAGLYHVALASLATGAVNIIPPVTSGETGTGNVLAASAGVWLYDTRQGAPSFARQWLAGGFPLIGVTGLYWTQTAEADGLLIEFRETATTTAGSRSATVTARAGSLASGGVSFSVVETATHATFTVTAPAEYVGTYGPVLLTTLAAGPWQAKLPTIASNAASPHPTFTATPGLWFGQNGGIVTTSEWIANGEIVGTGLTYLRQAGQESQEITYRETAADGAGQTVGDPVVAQAGAAYTPATIQLRDSRFGAFNNFSDVRPFGPSASYTNKGAYALRFTRKSYTAFRYAVGSDFGLFFNNNEIRIEDFPTGFNYPALFNASGGAVDIPFSLLVAWDGDAGLAGGKSLIIYRKQDSNAAGELFSTSATFATTFAPVKTIGAANTAEPGADLDLSDWFWAHDQAITDPAAAFSIFFNADGTVRDLGADGTAGGALPAPKLYMRANDFVTGDNRGTQGAVTLHGTPAVVL